MSRLAAGLWLAILVALPAPTGAQVLGGDFFGQPLRVVFVHLTPGRLWEIRTDYELQEPPSGGLARPNSVLSLMRVARRRLDGTVAGADGCNTPSGFDPEPSCFVYFTPVGRGVTNLYAILLRAKRGTTPGRTHLYIRDISDLDPTVPYTRITSTPISFGGGVVETNFAGSGRLFVHTIHRPGPNVLHEIWTARDNEWFVSRMDSFNGRVGETAMIDVPDLSAAGLAGPRRLIFGTRISTGGGPSLLIRNDWFAAGADFDQDGLGAALEADLGTCDRPGDPTVSFSCSSLRGCSAFASPFCDSDCAAERRECLQHLRDSDRDGLRDDLELFGYDDPLLHLARFGANPAHKDLFIEMDVFDLDPTTAATCEGFVVDRTDTLRDVRQMGSVATLTDDFFHRVQQVFGNLPASFNPDGRPGLNIHFDVGLDPETLDPNVPWGDFGGGNTCILDSSVCDYKAAYTGGDDCPGVRRRGGGPFSDRRRWVFLYGVDGPGGGGGQAANGTHYGANGASDHIHEIGHLGRLDHGGPQGTASERYGGANFRPNYPSRINYRYQNAGFQVFSGSAFGLISYSNGGWRPLSSDAADEVCPISADLSRMTLGGGVGAEAVGEFVSLPSTPPMNPACPPSSDVDWNRDAFLSTTPRHMETHRLIASQRMARWWQLFTERAVPSAPEVVTLHVDRVLMVAYPRRIPGGYELVFRADSRNECSRFPIDRTYRPCVILSGFEQQFLEDGRPLLARTLAISPAVIHPSGIEGAVLVYPSDDGVLHWGTLNISADPVLGARVLHTPRGVVPGPRVSPTQDAREIELHRTADGSVMLFFRDASSNVLQTVLPFGSTGWSPVVPAVTETNAVLRGGVAPGITRIGSEVFMAHQPPSGGNIIVRRMVRAVPLEQSTWQQVGAIPASLGQGRIQLVAAPSLDPPHDLQLHAFFRDSTQTVLWSRSGIGDSTVWEAPIIFNRFTIGGEVGVFGVGAALDARPSNLGFAGEGIRMVRFIPQPCREPTNAPNAFCDASSGFYRDSETGDPIGSLVFVPFAQGVEPGTYADYDDWLAFDWGFCESVSLAGALDAPAGTDDYVRIPYREFPRCGVLPAFAEPTAGAPVNSPAPITDRETSPGRYSPPGVIVCDGSVP